MSPEARQSLAGTWVGRFQQIECSTNAGDGRDCGHDRTGAVTLRISETSGAVTGELMFLSDEGNSVLVPSYSNATFFVRGTFTSSTLSLEGSIVTEGIGTRTEGRLTGWSTALVDRELSGETKWTTQSTSTATGGSAVTWNRRYRLIDLRRVAR